MVDLAESLQKFQEALSQRSIAPTRCHFHDHLHVLHDDADGMARVTYARIIDGEAEALVAFIPVEPYNELPCLNVGLAVAPSHRRKGLGTQVLKEALTELEFFLREGGIERYYIEGVASIHNYPSNKICGRIFTNNPNLIVCQQSGEDAFQYLKLYPEMPEVSLS